MKYVYVILIAASMVFGSRFIREFTDAIDQQQRQQALATSRLPTESNSSVSNDSGAGNIVETNSSTTVNLPPAIASQVIVSPEIEARIQELLDERNQAQQADDNGEATNGESENGNTTPTRQVARKSPPPIRHQAPLHEQMITPGNFEYVGAFRPPHVEDMASSFSYGGWGVAWRSDGDSSSDDDGYPGSLFLTGHLQHQMVAEISIPRPYLSVRRDINELPVAKILQPFGDISGGLQTALTDDPSQPYQVGGMQVVGNSLHWTIYRYYNVEGYDFLSHGISSLDTRHPAVAGPWHLGPFESGAPEWHAYKHAGYICRIPQETADRWFGGRNLMSGLQISTGLQTSSQGPALFAYKLPDGHLEEGGQLDASPLLWYPMDKPINEHHPADRWTGAAWVKLGQKEAVIVVGHKALGPVYYGDPRPGDCNPNKAYHGSSYEVQILFYTPAELIAVAHGQRSAWDIQPWYRWSGESPGGGVTQYMLSTCINDIGGMAFDSERNLLYIVQADAGATSDNEWEILPVIHVFRVVE